MFVRFDFARWEGRSSIPPGVRLIFMSKGRGTKTMKNHASILTNIVHTL